MKLKVAYARRGTNEERAVNDGMAFNVIDVDISFNEPLSHGQVLQLNGGQELYAYGVIDPVAEKYRALLQQIPHNRYRRQDVYDLDVLIRDVLADRVVAGDVLQALMETCSAHRLTPNRRSLDDSEVRLRSARDWDTMKLELDELPKFEDCYGRVAVFYRSLPWHGKQGGPVRPKPPVLPEP